MKKHEIFMVFRGNVISDVTADTPSDQGMLFGTFRMKNIFIKFPTPTLNNIFYSNSLKFSCFLQQTWWLCEKTALVVQRKLMKTIGFFNETEQKYSSKYELKF